ncbi:hypothetical protein EKH55_1785 [Sinorhizobium alkalisoli]|nr:hypothetical protein EKH55_1785 [Sinorhizobium alkalisoli]
MESSGGKRITARKMPGGPDGGKRLHSLRAKRRDALER